MKKEGKKKEEETSRYFIAYSLLDNSNEKKKKNEIVACLWHMEKQHDNLFTCGGNQGLDRDSWII